MYFLDLLDSFRSYKKWVFLSYYDIYKRYRRSKLGQIWITLSTAIMTICIAFIYSKLLKLNFLDYLIFLIQNLCLWYFIKDTIQDSLCVFYQNKVLLLNERWNHLVMILRVLSRNIIIYAHNFVLILFLNLFYNSNFSFFGFLIFILNLILIMPFMFSISLIGSIVVTRFRDMELMTANVLQLLFFVTPILYVKTFLGSYEWIADYNIFAIILLFVNGPLSLNFPNLNAYLIIIISTIITSVVSVYIYNLKRNRINYWL